jgi:hypothetical protein
MTVPCACIYSHCRRNDFVQTVMVRIQGYAGLPTLGKKPLPNANNIAHPSPLALCNMPLDAQQLLDCCLKSCSAWPTPDCWLTCTLL